MSLAYPARKVKWAWLDQRALPVHLDLLVQRDFPAQREPQALRGRRVPRGWQGWVCRGRRELSGRRAGGEERERAASLVPWARRDRKGEWGRKDRVVTLGLPVLREGWGNKVLWARRAWGCLVRLDRKGERGPLVLKDEGEKRGLVAYAVARMVICIR